MTPKRCRILTLLLVFSLLMSVLPSDLSLLSSARAEDVLGITTASGVNVRQGADTKAPYLFRLPAGYAATILEEKDVNGIHWYRVSVTHPDPDNTRTYEGYIHGSFFRRMTDEERSNYNAQAGLPVATATPDASGNVPTPTGVPVINGSYNAPAGTIGVVTNGGTNLRQGPSIKTSRLESLDRGTQVEVLTIPTVTNSSETFYQVRYGNLTGYIMSTFLRVSTVPVVVTATAAPAPVITAAPVVTAVPTAVPDPSVFTHVRLILSSCHMRETPGGKFDRDKDWEGYGSVRAITGSVVKESATIWWYPVTENGRVYYVRSDCVEGIISSGTPTQAPTTGPVITAAPTAVPTVTAAPGGIWGWVMTTTGGCNLRMTMGGTVIRQIGRYVTLPVLLAPVKSNGYTWYFVEAGNNRGYLRSDVVKVVNAPTAAPVVTATAAPVITGAPVVTGTAPTATPAQSTVTPVPPTGYVRTTDVEVNLRKEAGYKPIIGRIKEAGTILPYYGSPTTVSKVKWYRVNHPTMGYGYLHGEFVVECNADGSAITPVVTPTPTADPSGNVPTPSATPYTTASANQQEATYTTLKLGSSGTAVSNLIKELINQGFYTGTVGNKYNSAVENAVRAFQQAKGLTVDGIAGSATQHKLFGTVPVGSGDTSNLEFTFYPAEKIDWVTGGINELWARGSNYKVYDVKTGIVWWAHRWAGGLHVDAEPLTAADTARLCTIYGVKKSSEITSKTHYQRRPCLVTIGTRTFACSLYGVPHNEDGDTIANNDYTGQLCIHFTNSKIHNTKRVDSGHQEAIEYAWENAPAGHI